MLVSNFSVVLNQGEKPTSLQSIKVLNGMETRTMKCRFKLKKCNHVLVTFQRKKTNKQKENKANKRGKQINKKELNKIKVMAEISSFPFFSKGMLA